MKFLDLKAGEEIDVPMEHIHKVKWVTTTKNGHTRVTYARQAVLPDGHKYTRFMSKADWDALDVPEAETVPKG
jgi:hypothetical protein